MKRTLSRRDFIKLSAVGGGMAIFGFNPQSRSWITQAQAQTQSFSDIPNLDGVLLFDETTRKALSDDWGHLVHKIPAAVLRPKSVQDIVKIVQYANQHSIKIAVKGQAHCQYGQSQAEAGIVIDSGVLNAVQAPTADSVDVQPGVILGQLAGAALSKSLTPPVLPECMMLTVGGTLSAGGLGNTSQHHGALVDNVTELDVVTGDGRFVTCSPDRNAELFNMVLAGMGQCGIIVRARMRLVPLPSHAVLHNLLYADLEKYIADQARIAKEGRFDHQYGFASRKADGSWSFTMQVGKFFTPPDEPNLAELEQDLRFDSKAAPDRMIARDYLYRSAGYLASVRPAPTSAAASAPCASVTMWIPASATQDFIGRILALPPKLAGFQRFSFWPLNTRRFTRPLFKVPGEEQMFSVWLIRRAPPDDRVILSAMHASTRDLLANLTAVGGKRYAPWSPVISREEAQSHYGAEVWRTFSESKKRFDPNGVLAPQAAKF